MAEAPEVNDTSKCTICLGGFISPRTLPCLHSFCEMCISEYIVSTVTQPGQNTFNCPMCRSSVETEDPTMDKSEWVSFLPLKLDHEISKSSNESKKQQCHPCKRMENKVNASIWCCDCNEAFCQNCGDVHRNSKSSLTHRTVNIDTEEDLESEIDKFLPTDGEMCSIHESRRIEMYCSDHAQEICIRCLSADHGKCGNLEVIDSKEESLNTFKSEIGKLVNAVENLVEQKTESKRELQTKFTSIESQSLGTITQLKMKLDDLYIEFLKKAGLQQDKLQDEIDKILKSLSEYIVVLKEMIHNIELVARYGSTVQMFKTANATKRNLGKLGETLYPLLYNSFEFKVRGNFDPILNSFNDITELGDISISQEKRELTWSGDVPKLQDLLITNSEVEFSKVSLASSSVLNFPGKTVTSSVHLDKDTCAITLEKLLLIVLISSNEILHSVPLTDTPKKICFDSDKNILYGTCWHSSGFYCTINDKKIEEYRNCSFQRMVSGVDICEGNVYVATTIGIIQTKDFKNKNTWMTSSLIGSEFDISFHKQSKRFSFMTLGKKIAFGNLSDKSVKHVQDNSVISNPQSIAFGPSGMLFVAERPSVIRVISPDEIGVRTLLPKLQKIEMVYDITVSYDKKKLYVSGGNHVEIYDIVNDQKTN